MRRANYKVLILVTALALVAGCSSGGAKCRGGVYAESPTVDKLTVPDDLDRPQETSLAAIPPVPTNRERAAWTGCLEEPPRYFAKAGDPNLEGLPVAASSVAPGSQAEAVASAGGVLPGNIAGASILTNEISVVLANWADAWSARDADRWFDFYVSDYSPPGFGGPEEWRDAQRQRFSIPARTEVVFETLEVETSGESELEAKFVQRFGYAPDYRSVVKEVHMVTYAGNWKISEERIVDVL